MSGLLSELLQAGEWLRSRPTQSDAGLEPEVAEYRKQVVRLRELLHLAEGQSLHIYASKGHAEVMTDAVFEEESARPPVSAEAMRKLKQAGLK